HCGKWAFVDEGLVELCLDRRTVDVCVGRKRNLPGGAEIRCEGRNRAGRLQFPVHLTPAKARGVDRLVGIRRKENLPRRPQSAQQYLQRGRLEVLYLVNDDGVVSSVTRPNNARSITPDCRPGLNPLLHQSAIECLLDLPDRAPLLVVKAL